MREDVTIRPEEHRDYPAIIRLILRSFSEGTDYSDGTDVLALVEEIREGPYYIPALSFVAECAGEIVGHFMFSRFPLSKTPTGGHGGASDAELLMLAPVAVHADHFRRGIGTAMLTLGLREARKYCPKGISVEGNDRFYNRFGFVTSTVFDIHATSGFPLGEPRYMMCMEAAPGTLAGIHGYIVYDMYSNA